MAELTHTHRLNARSTPAVVAMKDRAVSELANEGGVRFRGRKLSDEAFINAAVMAFCTLPAGERAEVMARQIRELEAILDRPESPAGDEAGRPLFGAPEPPKTEKKTRRA